MKMTLSTNQVADQSFLDVIMSALFRAVVICLCLFAYLEFCRFTNAA
jgi:hypothetical protein